MTSGDLDHGRLPSRRLRTALEFAVRVADEGRRQRPPLAAPPVLRSFAGKPRVPTGALGKLRRAIDRDEAFREHLARAATPELVDPIGLLWLTRPDGWEANVAELVAAEEQAERDRELAGEVQRERKRREGAEARATRERTHALALEQRIEQLEAELAEARAELGHLADERERLRGELVAARNEARHANDRAAAATDRARELAGDVDDASSRARHAEQMRDDVLAERVDRTVEAARLADLAAAARDLASQLSALSGPGEREGPVDETPVRRPVSLPGGVLGDSTAAAEHLVRSGATVLVDGYNVSMLGWPDLDLGDQRRVLLDAVENLARRVGADVTVVFDGRDVAGAAAPGRRLVRVVFSPEGVTADDVIRAEVDRLPTNRAVVVVTNDAAIVRDVRARGANTLASDQFLAVARR